MAFRVLAQKTKNVNFKLKDESNGQAAKQVICSSPKQYIITGDPSHSFPVASSEHCELSKKAKGVPRHLHSKIVFHDFVTVAMKKQSPRVIIYASLRRVSLKIVMIKSKKKILSTHNSKRIFSNIFRTSGSFFSFPLNFKKQGLVD